MPNYHWRLGEKTVLLMLELCFCCDLVDGRVSCEVDDLYHDLYHDLYLYHLMIVAQVSCY